VDGDAAAAQSARHPALVPPLSRSRSVAAAVSLRPPFALVSFALFLLLGSTMPAATPPSPGRNAEEAGLSAGQIRARASATRGDSFRSSVRLCPCREYRTVICCHWMIEGGQIESTGCALLKAQVCIIGTVRSLAAPRHPCAKNGIRRLASTSHIAHLITYFMVSRVWLAQHRALAFHEAVQLVLLLRHPCLHKASLASQACHRHLPCVS
jgi:hypothetical protein